MKKFGKILIIALSLVVALSAFAIASSANSSPFLVEGLYRNSWEEAIENAYIKGDRIVPVELLGDYEVDGESVEITESVVISLNGHTLKSESGAPLFSVSGKDTTLTIVGPGTIECDGTFVEVQGGTLVLDATNGLDLLSSGSDSFAVIGGADEKAFASVTGNVNFESEGANLFELASDAEFKLSANCGVTATPSASASSPFAIVLVNSGAKVSLTGGTLVNAGGYIFNIGDDTEEENPVSINCESALLISDSATYGSIVEAGSAYANVNIRYSEITASGAAFSADNTLFDFDGDGSDKVYAKPRLRVNFTVSTYNVSTLTANANASLFGGNVTGIVTASQIWNTDKSLIGMNTRLWDGECGVIIKKGTKLSYMATPIASDTAAPLKDEDGVTVYFNPQGTTNNNFSLDNIDGKECALHRSAEIGADGVFRTCYLVTDEITSFADPDFSSNFNDVNGKHPVADAVSQSYGFIGYEINKDADGTENRFFKWEYDKNKSGEYVFASGNSYFELDAGSGGATRIWNGLHNNELITWDFDISNSNGTYSYAGLKLFVREGTSSYAYTDNLGAITGNTFKVGNVAYPLPTTPYVWTHITFVFDIDYSGSYELNGKTVYPNLGNTMIHFYANGEYQSSVKMFNDKISSEDGLKRSAEFSLDSIRFGLNGGTGVDKTKSTSLLFDNNIITYYPKGYEGSVSEETKAEFIENSEAYYNYVQSGGSDKTLIDFVGDINISIADALLNKRAVNLSNTYDALYRNGYKIPGGDVVKTERAPKLTVDGVQYYDVEEALRAITDNSVVYLHTDVEEQYNATSSFTVYTKKADGGNYKFNVISDSYYLSELRESGEVVGYKTLLANSFITVYWQINTGYKTEVPLGIVPTYDWILPSAYIDEEGRAIELVGWSSDKNATAPEEITQIDRDDLIKGYKVYYPVFAVTKVPVSFFDESGKLLAEKLVPIGTSYSDLTKYFDGSSFSTQVVESDKVFNYNFSGWKINGETSGTVGTSCLNALPHFNSPIAKDIKYSYTIERFTSIAPEVFVNIPGFAGFSFDGENMISSTDGSQSQVSIGDVKYVRFNSAATYNDRYLTYRNPGYVGNFIDKNEFSIYVHFNYEGKIFIQKINCSFNDYLDSSIKNASDEKVLNALMETVRLVDTYAALAKKTTLPVCDKYLRDTKYASYKNYLYDYTKVSEELISDSAKSDIAKNFETLFAHFEKNTRWDFANNQVYFAPRTDVHVNITNGYNAQENLGDFFHAQTTSRADTTLYPHNDMYTYYAAEGANAQTTIRGGKQGVFVVRLTSTGYGVQYFGALPGNDKISIKMQAEGTRADLFYCYYSLSSHILELERRSLEGEVGLNTELAMAQIIYSTQYAYSVAISGNDGRSFSLSQLGMN